LNVAKHLVLTGKPLSVDRAYSLGLVNIVAGIGSALNEAVTLAETIANNAPIAVQESLKALERCVSSDDQLGWVATAEAEAVVISSVDMREGVAAFFERRAPQWTGM
jgi:enoyl-CoA hydratase